MTLENNKSTWDLRNVTFLSHCWCRYRSRIFVFSVVITATEKKCMFIGNHSYPDEEHLDYSKLNSFMTYCFTLFCWVLFCTDICCGALCLQQNRDSLSVPCIASNVHKYGIQGFNSDDCCPGKTTLNWCLNLTGF